MTFPQVRGTKGRVVESPTYNPEKFAPLCDTYGVPLPSPAPLSNLSTSNSQRSRLRITQTKSASASSTNTTSTTGSLGGPSICITLDCWQTLANRR